MQVAQDQLASHLKRGLRNLYVLHGDEPLLQLEAQDAIRAAARLQGYTERSVFTVMGAHFDWASVLAAGGSMSLFADKLLLELRIPSGKPGKDGSQILQQMAEQAAGNEGVLTLLTLPKLDFASKKSAWFSALEGHGLTVALEGVERQALPNWIAHRLGRAGLRVADGEEGLRSLEFFANRVEGNLLAAHQEIEKLALLHGSQLAAQPITAPVVLSLEQIERSVLNVARYDTARLSQAVLAGNSARVLRMIEGLEAEGEAAVMVLWTLAEDIRALKRIKEATSQGQPLPLALREQRIWGPKERLFERALPNLSVAALRGLLRAAHTTDGIVKGLKQPDWPHEPWPALQRLALALSRACAGQAGQPHQHDRGALRKMAA